MKTLTTQQKIALALKYPHVARVIEQHTANELFSQMKSYKGEKGDVGKQGLPGKNGLNGRDGKDGKNGKDGRDGFDGRDGKDGKEGLDAIIDYAKIIKELRAIIKDGEKGKDATVDNEMIEVVLKPHLARIYDHVNRSMDGMPRGSNYGGFIETSIKAGANIVITKDGTGAWVITSTASGSGGGGALADETPVGTINGVNTTFTVGHQPLFIQLGTGILATSTDWTYSAGTLTMAVAPRINQDGSTPTFLSFYNSGTQGSPFQTPVSGVVDGVNRTFTWSVVPNVICVDQGRNMQRVNNGDGNINWTGTTTTVLQIAPVSDIFSPS